MERLRARFPASEVRPRSRLASALDDGAWIAALQVAGDDPVARSVFVHTAAVGDAVVSTLVTLAPDGSAVSEPLGVGTHNVAAVAAVRAMLARDGDGSPR